MSSGQKSDVMATSHFENIGRLYVGWPTRADTWRDGGAPARIAVTRFVETVLANTTKAEVIVVGCDSLDFEHPRCSTLQIPHDDCWLQDIGPVFVRSDNKLGGLCFAFNAWGGECYSDYAKDALFARNLLLSRNLFSLHVPLSLEGGALSSDGKGTFLITKECVQHRGLTEEQVESALRASLGAKRIVWLPTGAAYDSDTHGHVDNIAVFAGQNRVVLHWADDQRSTDALATLENAGLIVHKVDAPPVQRRTMQEAAGVKGGAKPRPAGEPLCASYTNFVFVENTVVVPSFGVEEADTRARKQIEHALGFTGRTVVMVDAREFILAGGGLHCISLAEPTC